MAMSMRWRRQKREQKQQQQQQQQEQQYEGRARTMRLRFSRAHSFLFFPAFPGTAQTVSAAAVALLRPARSLLQVRPLGSPEGGGGFSWKTPGVHRCRSA